MPLILLSKAILGSLQYSKNRDIKPVINIKTD